MKTPILLTALIGFAILPLLAQDSSSDGDQGGHRPPPPRPSRLVLTLDADHDKVISATEIAGAPTALAALDKNSDGQLSKDEFCGPKPPKDKDSKARADGDSDKPSGHRPPPPDPLVGALDADHDKVISAAELAAAAAELATLDKNADGQLSKDEFAPPPPKRPHHGPANSDDDDSDSSGHGGQGGQPGGRPPGGPQDHDHPPDGPNGGGDDDEG